MNNKMLFSLGTVVCTPGTVGMNHRAMQDLLNRHQSGDWGDVCQEDKEANDADVEGWGGLMSVYNETEVGKVWIMTEWDRSVTTVLLPEEY